MILAMASFSVFADKEVWRLDLATESGEVSPEAFPAWMEMKGFKPFSYLFFKRRPEHWQIGPCEATPQSCLVLQENDSSSHIIYTFEHGLAVEDSLAVELAYQVKLQPKGASLDRKDKEDAPLRIFLTFQTNDGLLHQTASAITCSLTGQGLRLTKPAVFRSKPFFSKCMGRRIRASWWPLASNQTAIISAARASHI